MACNQYTINFAVNQTITFSDCSGVTQTLSGQTGQNFNICASAAPTLPSGVTLTDNGEAEYYFFSSCCGNYFFYLCYPVSSPPSSVQTFGSTYFQFEDGTFTESKCVIYNASAVPPTEYYIPRVVAVNNDSIFTQGGDYCTTCNAILPSNYCLPNYFKSCCCTYDEPNIPLNCYFVYSSKSNPFVLGNAYLFELTTGEKFCGENVSSTTENFYAVQEYIAADFTSYTDLTDCETCLQTTPCPSPTPTPTPTNTPTPTVTPTVTPTPSSTSKFVNECDVLTIFEMGAECVILQPSTNDSNDGVASVKITGGTPPYTITWSNGNIASAIGNLTIGSYEATIVDSYGDFTAKTVCVLTGQTILPTPTPTPTATMPITGPQFCMNVKTEGPGINLSFEQTFTVDSYLFGKPSWISGNGQYRIYWSTLANPNVWIMSGTSNPVLLVNMNPANPPINLNWQAYGGIIQNLEVTEGPCSPIPMLLSPLMIANPNIELYVVKNDTICGCEGSIIANADGGNPPYQYSVDNGITYKNVPIFQNLCSGVYTVSVLDNLGYGKTTQITINEPQQPTTYVVNLTKTSNIISQTSQSQTVTYDVQVVVDPPLPPTTTLTFDLVHTNTFGVSTTFSSATLVSNTVLYTNEIPVAPSNTSIDNSSSINTTEGCQDQTVFSTATTEFWYGLTYTSSDDIIINTTTTLTRNFSTACDSAFTDDNFNITNLTISGCNCCAVQNITL